MDAGGKLSIYRAARSIKRRDNNLYNALRSIHEDSIFVGEISQLWPDLPLLANLRCGLWYTPKFYSTCYFKSTDGHQNNWSFSTTRLNLHVALLAGQKGGCIIVDSTRRGKRFPDSMSKTIPIWSCVLNRAIFNYVKNSKRDGNSMMKEEAGISNHAENARVPSPSWDCSLHLPLWVPEIEKAAIEERLEGWINQLEASGADLVSLASCLKKPFRPLWISQKTVIWLNEVPHHDSWDFTPIILVSASSPSDVYRHRTTSEFSWSYIAGAGDDEESWARGLSPGIFWNHAYDLIAAGPDLCNQKVADIVEKERVYRAQRGQIAPQITVRAPKTLDNIADLSHEQPSLSSDMFDSGNTEKSPDEERTIYWLGSTNLAVGTTQFSMHNFANMSNGDCILNCDQESISVSLPDNQPYLHLPMVSSKMERFSILRNLPAAVNFAELNLCKRNRILVCCCSGEDISVCVCLAILISLFNEEGTFDHGNSFREKQITKLEMRRRLVFICQFAIRARPSRGNLRQVFGFLTGGGAGLTGRSPSLLSPGIDGNLQE